MCALFGYLDYGKKLPMKVLQKLVQALAEASEERGTHASGIAYNTPEKLRIYKRPLPAHKLHFRIPKNTTAVMGHTRLTTQGDQKLNYNNHPFPGHAGTDFALAHNGIIYNDSHLRTKLLLPDTQIETDSYIAVQLIESRNELDFASLRYAAETVRGYFTFSILDRGDNLYLVKGESPLYLLHFPSIGLYVYTSTKEIMTTALRKLKYRLPASECVPVEEGEILMLSADGTMCSERFTMQDELYGALYRTWGYGYSWSYPECKKEKAAPEKDEEYGVLLELCSYYGVDPDEIEAMQEMGYSYDEIEEMLVNSEAYGIGCACMEW